MNRTLDSLGGALLVLAGVVAAGCGDKITNIYVINDASAPGTGGAAGNSNMSPDGGAAGGAAGAATDAAAATDEAPPPSGDAMVTPPAPAADSGAPPAAYAGKPWNGMPQAVPGTLQFEFYDQGGEGVAFHDNEAMNQGPADVMFRRMEGVDITVTRPGTDQYMSGMPVMPNQMYVGWTAPGEWLKYTISVAETGNYMLSMHTSANSEGSTISFTFEDGTTTGALPIARTGSWNIWQHADNMAIIKLGAGTHVMTVKLEAVGNNNLDYLIFTRKP